MNALRRGDFGKLFLGSAVVTALCAVAWIGYAIIDQLIANDSLHDAGGAFSWVAFLLLVGWPFTLAVLAFNFGSVAGLYVVLSYRFRRRRWVAVTLAAALATAALAVIAILLNVIMTAMLGTPPVLDQLSSISIRAAGMLPVIGLSSIAGMVCASLFPQIQSSD